MIGSLKVRRQRFWKELLMRAQKRGYLLGTQRITDSLYWAPVRVGVPSGVNYSYTVWTNRSEAAVELYIHAKDRDESKRIFDTLHEKQQQIGKSFGESLRWERLSQQKASRIRHVLKKGGLNDEANWPTIQEEMISAMEKLVTAINPHLVNI